MINLQKCLNKTGYIFIHFQSESNVKFHFWYAAVIIIKGAAAMQEEFRSLTYVKVLLQLHKNAL